MKGKLWKKLCAGALALLIVSGGVPVQPIAEYLNPAITASAKETYLSEKPISVSGTVNVDADVSIDYPIGLAGDTELYLREGCTLTFAGNVGMIRGNGHNLTIVGKGTIDGRPNVSGIREVNNLVIESGTIKLESVMYSAIKATNVTINNGNIRLTSLSPNQYGIEATNTLNLNGGTVYANKYSAEHIYINGVEAQASQINNKTLQLGYKTITWKNYDGTTLKTEQANYGETPSYSGTPIKPATAQYTYTFSGWSPAVSAVTEDQTYTAQYSSTVNKYTVTWKDSDNSTLKTEQVNYGETPSYGETPTKASDEKYTYTFKEWSPAITSVTGAATYTAVYTKTPNAAYFSQSGNTYTIHDETGWEIFCDCLQDNDTYNRFSGKTVELGDNISVSRIAGSSSHDFMGTFDGKGHTLTVNYGSADSPIDEDKAAPFCNVENGCNIKNLHTAGTIYTSKKYAGGIVGTQYGTVTISNCRSSVTIQSSTKGDGTHGGFVGNNGSSNSAKLTIEGCVFDGKIVSTGTGDDATTSCGGFVGWKYDKGSLTIINSLYAPTADDNAVADGATFARNWTMPDNANCYYTATLGTAQGKQAYTITPGADVTLGLSGTATTDYDVSGIRVYESGIECNGKLYVCSGETVELELNYTGTPPSGCFWNGYTASAGTLNGTTLTMPAGNVVVNAAFLDPSTFLGPDTCYFDENTSTLYLRGNVDKADVQQYKDRALSVVAEDGTVLPQDSSGLFNMFTSVTSIDLAYADTSSVTNMSSMFNQCEELTALNVSGFDTKNVTNMNSMFYCCSELTTLDVSGFDTSSVKDMRSMFQFCNTLTTLDVSGFDTSSVEDMGCMFDGCNFLTTLDLSSFDTSSVTDMGYMFCSCDELTTLDLSGFDTHSVKYMHGMFYSCVGLRTIYVSNNWNTDNVHYADDMFFECYSLKGGSNTPCDGVDNINGEYARIDKGDEAPGYLTGTYSVSVDDDITISPVNAIIGNTPYCVPGETITISPKDGYTLTSVTATAGDTAVGTKDNNDGTYSFIMPAGEVSVEAETAFTDGVGARLEGYSISLEPNSGIGINFYMSVDEAVANDETAKMRFEIPSYDEYSTQYVPISQAQQVQVGGKTYYVFKCSVAAKEMTSTIKARIYVGEEATGAEYTYSVKEYADYVIANAARMDAAAGSGSMIYRDAVPLLRAMLKFGAESQNYFDFHKERLAYTDNEEPQGYAEIPDSIASDDYNDESFNEYGLVYYGSSMKLKSKTSYLLYFTKAPSFTALPTVKKGETEIKPVMKDGYVVYEIKDIEAGKLTEAITLTFNETEFTFHPSTYLKKAKSDDEVKALAKAMYNYDLQAKTYAGRHQQ